MKMKENVGKKVCKQGRDSTNTRGSKIKQPLTYNPT